MTSENSTLNEKMLLAAAGDAGLTAEDRAALQKCRQQVVADNELCRIFSGLYDELFPGVEPHDNGSSLQKSCLPDDPGKGSFPAGYAGAFQRGSAVAGKCLPQGEIKWLD